MNSLTDTVENLLRLLEPSGLPERFEQSVSANYALLNSTHSAKTLAKAILRAKPEGSLEPRPRETKSSNNTVDAITPEGSQRDTRKELQALPIAVAHPQHQSTTEKPFAPNIAQTITPYTITVTQGLRSQAPCTQTSYTFSDPNFSSRLGYSEHEFCLAEEPKSILPVFTVYHPRDTTAYDPDRALTTTCNAHQGSITSTTRVTMAAPSHGMMLAGDLTESAEDAKQISIHTTTTQAAVTAMKHATRIPGIKSTPERTVENAAYESRLPQQDKEHDSSASGLQYTAGDQVSKGSSPSANYEVSYLFAPLLAKRNPLIAGSVYLLCALMVLPMPFILARNWLLKKQGREIAKIIAGNNTKAYPQQDHSQAAENAIELNKQALILHKVALKLVIFEVCLVSYCCAVLAISALLVRLFKFFVATIDPNGLNCLHTGIAFTHSAHIIYLGIMLLFTLIYSAAIAMIIVRSTVKTLKSAQHSSHSKTAEEKVPPPLGGTSESSTSWHSPPNSPTSLHRAQRHRQALNRLNRIKDVNGNLITPDVCLLLGTEAEIAAFDTEQFRGPPGEATYDPNRIDEELQNLNRSANREEIVLENLATWGFCCLPMMLIIGINRMCKVIYTKIRSCMDPATHHYAPDPFCRTPLVQDPILEEREWPIGNPPSATINTPTASINFLRAKDCTTMRQE